MSAFSIGFFRSVFGLMFVAPWIVRRRAHIAKTNYVWLHLIRAALKVLALAAFFYAISRANLSQVTAIAFTTPIFVIVGAALILGRSSARAAYCRSCWASAACCRSSARCRAMSTLSCFSLWRELADRRHAAGAESHGGKGFDRYAGRMEPRADGAACAFAGLVFLDDAEPFVLGLLAVQGAMGRSA